jgi:hypothetical protein
MRSVGVISWDLLERLSVCAAARPLRALSRGPGDLTEMRYGSS